MFQRQLLASTLNILKRLVNIFRKLPSGMSLEEEQETERKSMNCFRFHPNNTLDLNR